MRHEDAELFQSELSRLEFVRDKFGDDYLKEFCRRGMSSYRYLLKNRKGICTRRALVISCVVYRAVLRAREE